MAIGVNIQFFKGEDITIEDVITGVDITSWSITFSIRETFADDVLISKTVGSGITLTDPTNGKLQIVLSDDDTNLLSSRNYVYDVKRMDAGSEAVLTYGILTIQESVTE